MSDVVIAAVIEAAGKVAAAKISKWSSGQEARDQSKKDVEDAFLDVLNAAKHHKLTA